MARCAAALVADKSIGRAHGVQELLALQRLIEREIDAGAQSLFEFGCGPDHAENHGAAMLRRHARKFGRLGCFRQIKIEDQDGVIGARNQFNGFLCGMATILANVELLKGIP